MVTNHKPTGRSVSMPAGLTQGAIMAMVLTIAGCAIIAKAVETEILAENRMGYAIMIMLILTSWVSALYSHKKIKTRRVVVCMISGGIYMMVLMGITALFFGGQYTAVGETALLVFCGSMLASLQTSKEKRRGGKSRVKIRNR